MTKTDDTRNTVKQVLKFFPNIHGGKYHAKPVIGDVSLCGGIILDTTAGPIMPAIGDDITTLHPIMCRRCLKHATKAK